MELLLTMPITPWQAIVGKFLASWVFLGLALALTFPVVITVNWLGDPDNGVIFAGYVGSFLLAGAYLAISCMTSAMTRNQVISFILSVMICLFLILAGYTPVTDLLTRLASPAVVAGRRGVLGDDALRRLPARRARRARRRLLRLRDRLRAVHDRRHHPQPAGRVSHDETKHENLVVFGRAASSRCSLVLDRGNSSSARSTRAPT